MLSLDFKSKLKRLNPLLYVLEGPRVSSLMLAKAHGRTDKKSDYNYLEGEAAKHLEAVEAGLVDEHICGIPKNYIPEWDQLDVETGRITDRGWRSILKILVEKRYASLEAVRKHFSASLMEADYDFWPLAKRLAKARE